MLSKRWFIMIDDHSQSILSLRAALSFLNFHLISFLLSAASPRESKLLLLLRKVWPGPTLLEATLWNVETAVREEVVLPRPPCDYPLPSHFPLSKLHSRSPLGVLAASYLGESSGSQVP